MFCRGVGTCCWSSTEVRKKGYVKEGDAGRGDVQGQNNHMHMYLIKNKSPVKIRTSHKQFSGSFITKNN